MDNSINLKKRKKARQLVLQALYQWELSKTALADIELQQFENINMEKVDIDYFRELFYQIPKNVTAVDASFEGFLDRGKSELNPIELTILRLGSYELMHRLDVPYRVVIKESVDLARTFGATDGHKYVNGILDKVAKVHRQSEISPSNDG